MAFECDGCNTEYSSQGQLIKHIEQTRNPACRAAYLNINDIRSSNSSSEADDDDLDEDLPPSPASDGSPPPFGGDMFGVNYAEHDFVPPPPNAVSPTGNEANAQDADNLPDVAMEEEDDQEYYRDVLSSSEDKDEWVANPGREPRPNIAHLQEPADQPEELDIPQHVIDNAHSNRTRVEQALRGQLFSIPYPSTKAGSPIPEQELRTAGYAHYASRSGGVENPYAPFKSKLDWEVARWAKLHGPSSTAVSELLSIPEVCTKLDLSFKNSRELNALVDKIPNLRPRFKVKEIELGDEIYEVYFRDALECVRALFGEPEFAPHVITKPGRFYADANRTQRVHWDMFTGKWWWAMQKELDSVKEGGTVVPIIVSTDRTQVTLFRNKAAYPVYLTIGNLPKEI
ncbi:hypothetical protein K474DRAFT_1716561 [Panus rudis PR-1116 ss-1]|nr:hypothetical protein K474DRAFT_1716561 [Panus rudis PR-1116 ss-1]